MVIDNVFYKKLFNIVQGTIAYADLLPIYKCCEFLLIPEKDIRTLMMLCTYIMKGVYDKSAIEVFLKYPEMVNDKVFRLLSIEHIAKILPLLSDSTNTQLMVTTLYPDKCYEIYKHDPTIIEQEFTCDMYVSNNIAECVNFGEFYEVYIKMRNALLTGDEEMYIRLMRFTSHALKYVTKKEYDPTFNKEQYQTVDLGI
jgi:hypothetical protein